MGFEYGDSSSDSSLQTAIFPGLFGNFSPDIASIFSGGTTGARFGQLGQTGQSYGAPSTTTTTTPITTTTTGTSTSDANAYDDLVETVATNWGYNPNSLESTNAFDENSWIAQIGYLYGLGGSQGADTGATSDSGIIAEDYFNSVDAMNSDQLNQYAIDVRTALEGELDYANTHGGTGVSGLSSSDYSTMIDAINAYLGTGTSTTSGTGTSTTSGAGTSTTSTLANALTGSTTSNSGDSSTGTSSGSTDMYSAGSDIGTQILNMVAAGSDYPAREATVEASSYETALEDALLGDSEMSLTSAQQGYIDELVNQVQGASALRGVDVTASSVAETIAPTLADYYQQYIDNLTTASEQQISKSLELRGQDVTQRQQDMDTINTLREMDLMTLLELAGLSMPQIVAGTQSTGDSENFGLTFYE